MGEKDLFIGEPAAFLVEWMRETEQTCAAGLAQTERQLRAELKASDEELLKTIQRQVDTKIRDAQDAVRRRLADAEKAERSALEVLAKARELEADVNRRLRNSIGVHLAGVPGPAAAGRPLGELLRSRFSRAVRYRGEPPLDAWYVVGDLAFKSGDGEGITIRPSVTLEQADAYADAVAAVVVGVVDESLESLATGHGCSLYGSVDIARRVAEGSRAYVKAWLSPVTRAAAFKYCEGTWSGASDGKLELAAWLSDTRGFTLVDGGKKGAARTWVLDMGDAVDVASWTDRCEETFHQLVAAGMHPVRDKRKRAKADKRVHGEGFYVATDMLKSIVPAAKQVGAPTDPSEVAPVP